jgi:hypothetical protein
MRIQVIRKQISDNYFCIAVGYCKLQSLLSYESSPYYTAGTYGWNFDVYPFDFHGMNVAITTGYRGMVRNCGIEVSYNTCQKYEKLAREILAKYEPDNREQLRTLIDSFLEEVFKPLLKEGK